MVVIGRNEGERLRRALESLAPMAGRIVYVDSDSTDGSVSLASSLGAEVISLDMSVPFTAARARNQGFQRLRTKFPGVEYVQFLDGDCEMNDDWLATAAAFMADHADVAAVCGRLRERHPTRTIYNMLCDIEWDTPVGEAKACGGIAMMRAGAFASVHGFRADLIAGEEPELCVRLRASGWRIWRLGVEMALHDAAIERFGQWWKRALRGGFAYAQGVYLHGAPPERHCVRESRRIWMWGLVIPVAILTLAPLLGAWVLAAFLVYPAQVIRLALRGASGERPARERWLHAAFLMLAKFPELCGQVKFAVHRHLGQPSRLIEYK